MDKCPIKIPDRVKALPAWGRFPIPYFAHVDKNGVPDFRVFNHDHYRKAVINRLCGICGKQLGVWLSFIGGFTCLVTRSFTDLPMHQDCAVFTMQICPFLGEAAIDYSTREYPEDLVAVRKIPVVIEPVIKPRISLIYKCKNYSVIQLSDGGTRLVAREVFGTRFFQSGKEISTEDVKQQIENVMGEKFTIFQFADRVIKFELSRLRNENICKL